MRPDALDQPWPLQTCTVWNIRRMLARAYAALVGLITTIANKVLHSLALVLWCLWDWTVFFT